MPLDAETRIVLNAFNAQNYPPNELVPITALREKFEGLMVPSSASIREMKEIEIEGPYRKIRLRLYFPKKTGKLPVFVTYHGGGWVVGSLNTHDPFCREICHQAEGLVVSVDYGLAPENQFPQPLEECYAATQWVSQHIHQYGGNPDRMIIGGDSAGGNLAAAICLLSKERKGPKITAQVLLYPVTNHNFDTHSYWEFAENYIVRRKAMIWYWDLYLARPEDGKNPHASPLQAHDLQRLPPALFIMADCDPLRDDGLAYAARLKAAGVPTEIHLYDTVHGFILFAPQLSVSQQALKTIAHFIKTV